MALLLDVLGCRVRVEGPAAQGWFRTELGAFEVPELADVPHVEAAPRRGGGLAPIRPKGSRHGVWIRGPPGARRVEYDEKLDPKHVLPWVEVLIDWPDKTPAHASGVERDGRAHVFFAGPKTGKTTTLLGLLRDGFRFLGDDLVVVGNGLAYPYPKTVHLYDYNLVDDAALRARVLPPGLPWRALLRARAGARRAFERLPTRGARFAGEVAFGRMITVAPIERVVPGARVGEPSPIAGATWLMRGDVPAFERREISAEELAERALNASFHERADHIGRVALASALHGEEERVDERLRRAREALRTSLGKARRMTLVIPREAPPHEVLREIRRLVAEAA